MVVVYVLREGEVEVAQQVELMNMILNKMLLEEARKEMLMIQVMTSGFHVMMNMRNFLKQMMKM